MKSWWKNERLRPVFRALLSLAVGFCAALPKHAEAERLAGAWTAASPSLGLMAPVVFLGQAAGCLLFGGGQTLPVSAAVCLFLLIFRKNICKGKRLHPILLGVIRGVWGVTLAAADGRLSGVLLAVSEAVLEGSVLFFLHQARQTRLHAPRSPAERMTAYVFGAALLCLADGGTAAGLSLTRAVLFILLAACVVCDGAPYGVAAGISYALGAALTGPSVTPLLPVALGALIGGICFRKTGAAKAMTAFAVGGVGVWLATLSFRALPLLPAELAAALIAARFLPREKPRPAPRTPETLPAEYRDLVRRVDDIRRAGSARVTFYPETARAARDALQRAGYLAPGVTCAKDLLGGFFLDITFEKNGRPVSRNALLGMMERVCGFPLAVRRFFTDEKTVAACFIRKAPFTVRCAAVCKSKTGETVCGDNAVAFSADQTHYMLLLSDGMGSGKDAFAQSFWTVTLLQKLLRAGVAARGAVSMVHSSLQMKNEDLSFATVDLCGIDLNTGRAEFIKAGAVSTFIAREDKVVEISAVSMPLGATEQADVATARETLRPGDLIVLISDGALEQKDDILSLLPQKRALPCETVAADLMRCVCERQGAPDDDITVLVARFCENE